MIGAWADAPSAWPRFCCAILRDDRGRYLLEQRRIDDEHMPGQLVCFGGGRERDEHPDACVRRELLEEIGWAPPTLRLCLRLLGRDGRVIAWFYRGIAPMASEIRTEPGVRAVWASWDELSGLPVGDWNLAAIIAEQRGLTETVVDG